MTLHIGAVAAILARHRRFASAGETTAVTAGTSAAPVSAFCDGGSAQKRVQLCRRHECSLTTSNFGFRMFADE